MSKKKGGRRRRIRIASQRGAKLAEDKSKIQPVETKKEETQPETIKFWSLRVAADRGGTCVKCRKSPNGTQLLKTDEGMKYLIVCSKCGTKMVPRT